MDSRYYERYKDLIGKLDYKYEGYNLKYLLPGYLTWVFDDYAISARDIFKEFYKGTQLYDLTKILQIKTPTIITYLINRSDYKELSEAAQKSYPDSEIVNIESLPQKKFAAFSFTYFSHFFKALSISFGRQIKEPFTTKLYLAAIIIKIFNYIQILERYKFPETAQKYICFNTAYKEESILTMYFKKHKVETITMQHGIFCDFKHVIPFDIINFANLISDKVLCWGQSTVDYLVSKGIDRSRLILMGNPKYKDIAIEHIDRSFKKCLVLLGRQIYIPSNDKLLALLREYNRKNNNKILFYIKKHPFLMDSDHKSFASIADNMIFLGKDHSTLEVLKSDLVNFSIAVNTTAYYESLALGKISLRWAETENEDFIGMNDKFVDMEGFESKIKQFSEMPEEEIRKEMKDVIRYVFNPDLQ